MKYEETNLNPIIKKNVKAINYHELTKIQELAIPLILEEKNIIGLAQTGTGKTAAFLLPIIHKLLQSNHKNHKPKALVLAPTRDLIYQIFENFLAYSKNTNLRCVCVFGGVGYEKQISQIKKGVDIVFANTGRLMDLAFKRKILDLSEVEYFVLDEADQMLDMGFSKDIEAINSALVKKQQVLLFSATMPVEVKKLIGQIFKGLKYETINALTKTNINDFIKQEMYLVNHKKRNSVLVDILQKKLSNKQAIIFCRTKSETKDVYQLLKDLNFRVDCLHSDRSQPSRVKAIKSLKNYDIDILVATNIAARGIDINNLEFVINYNLPDDDETFVHRIGRTGRKGNSGVAITLISPKELYRLRKIEELIHTKIDVIRDEKYLSKEIDEKLDVSHHYKNVKNNQKSKTYDKPKKSKSNKKYPPKSKHKP